MCCISIEVLSYPKPLGKVEYVFTYSSPNPAQFRHNTTVLFLHEEALFLVDRLKDPDSFILHPKQGRSRKKQLDHIDILAFFDIRHSTVLLTIVYLMNNVVIKCIFGMLVTHSHAFSFRLAPLCVCVLGPDQSKIGQIDKYVYRIYIYIFKRKKKKTLKSSNLF